MIKHIIFDLDGVLVDAVELHFHAFNAALFEKTGQSIGWEEHNEKFNGLPTISKLKKMGFTDERIISDINRLKQTYTSSKFNDLSVDRNLISILSELKENYVLSCASNSTRNTVVIALKRLGIDDLFSSVFSNNDVNEPKPSPEIYYRCMLSVGIYVPQTMIIEDSLVGAEAALRSGCRICMVKNRADLTYEKVIEYAKA